MSDDNTWALADRISDQIIDLLNLHTKSPDFNPLLAFCGQLLAIVSFGRTAPPGRPPEFERVINAAEKCLRAAYAGEWAAKDSR